MRARPRPARRSSPRGCRRAAKWASLLALLLATLLAAVTAQAQDTPSRAWRVLVVHSYHPEYAWTRNIDQGLREALADLDIQYRFLHMNAKRDPDRDKLARFGREAEGLVQSWRPDLVVAADDAAQAYFVAPYRMGKTGPPVIFCGVNANPEEYGYPAAGVTGVLEKFHFRESFALLKRIMPSVGTVAYLSDNSDTADFLIRDLKDELAKGPLPVELAAVEAILTFGQWKKAVEQFQTRADALALGVYQSLKDDATGRTVSAEEVIAWTRRHNAKPTVGFVDYAVDHHLMCGVLEMAEEQGYLAGRLAREVLVSGRPAGELPMAVNHTGVVMVNLKAAEELGVLIPYEVIEAAGVVVK